MIKHLFVSIFLLTSINPAYADSKDKTAFERVATSNTLRCGYFVYPPFLEKNLETGEFTGIYPDIFNEIAKQSGLKIEWAEEIGSDVMFTGLNQGRYDAICAPVTYTVARARQAFFANPFMFVPFYVYVRADDKRFDKDPYTSLNSAEIHFSVKDGDLTEILAKETFPLAKSVSLTGLSDASQLMSTVTTGKADAIIGEPIYAGIFMENNPNKLKQLDTKPVQIIPGTAAVPIGDTSLLEFLNISFKSLQETGFIEKTLSKHINNSDQLLFPAPAYK